MVQNRKLLEDAAYQEAYKQASDKQSHENANRIKQSFQNINTTR